MPDSGGEALRAYLTDRDAPCPGCGYNLRGVVGERCPECARPLALVVARAGPAAALTWFFLLAFGWVFAAGAMNLVRDVRSILWYTSEPQYSLSYQLSLRQGLSSRLVLPVAPAAPPPSFLATAWNNVPASMLASTAWAFTILLLAGVGLVLMLRRGRHPFGPRGDARLTRFACTAFAVYAGWHVITFLMEFA